MRAAQELDKAARGRQGAVRNTQGQLFDPNYQETHTTELARMKREGKAGEREEDWEGAGYRGS